MGKSEINFDPLRFRNQEYDENWDNYFAPVDGHYLVEGKLVKARAGDFLYRLPRNPGEELPNPGPHSK